MFFLIAAAVRQVRGRSAFWGPHRDGPLCECWPRSSDAGFKLGRSQRLVVANLPVSYCTRSACVRFSAVQPATVVDGTPCVGLAATVIRSHYSSLFVPIASGTSVSGRLVGQAASRNESPVCPTSFLVLRTGVTLSGHRGSQTSWHQMNFSLEP